MKVSLVVLSAGKASGQTIPIALPQFVIGRDPQCNLRPASPLISKRHCAVKVRQGKVYIEDYGSTNGTFLNDQPVKGEVAMKDGDFLKAGPLSFKVAIEGQPAANPTPTNKNLPATISPAKAVAGKLTPPPPVKVPVPAGEHSDDDLAAMMLEGGDAESGAFDDSQVPGGSTIMDLPIPPEVAAAAADTNPEVPAKIPTPLPENKPEAAAAPEAKKPEAKKPDSKGDNAQSAAKALLEKMYRRGRPG